MTNRQWDRRRISWNGTRATRVVRISTRRIPVRRRPDLASKGFGRLVTFLDFVLLVDPHPFYYDDPDDPDDGPERNALLYLTPKGPKVREARD